MKPFAKLQDVFVVRAGPPTPYVIGDRVTVLSVVNTGTKRNPAFRYAVAGAWFDHDALSLTNPLA